ncbi:EF-hand domain-containing protein [Sphingomonas xanthus]|uniref:Calcium-binding protein n=1 Tax=Sphingomonas xanthus TaxID=2594473 RepID=A0A516IRD7_9SPHN|nr:EF-hand domain-containing protein [Sphingomonas xanthus]QDP19458.1 calcium-binding protein [Sphingomonas xanthus]
MKYSLIAAALATVAGAAIAQSSPAPTAKAMMADKVMTRAEVPVKVREHFARVDADKDGVITKDEVAKLGDRAGGSHFRHEMRERGNPAEAFDRLDADKDGMISREEFGKAREKRIERRVVIRERAKEAAADGQPQKMRSHRMGGMGHGRMLAMADANKDGRTTLAEAEAMALQHFDRMDANNDGQVTPEERRAGRPVIIKQVIEKKQAS